MNPEAREQLRLSLIRFLDANNTRFGIGTALLLQHARAEGRPDLKKTDVDAELRYLEDKGYAEEALKGISPENPAWRITAAGRDFYAQLTSE